MTTPNLSLAELVASQSQPHVPVNSALRRLDALAPPGSPVLAIQNTPPGSPVDGDRYIVGTSPTGTWAGHENELAAYIGTGWQYFAPEIGWVCSVQALAALYVYGFGSPIGWDLLQTGGGGAAAGVITDATAARVLALTDAGQYIRMTSGSANTVTVPPNADEPFEIGDEVHVRQAGAGATSLVAGAGVTINGSLSLTGQHATCTVKKVATNTWDAFGSLE